MGVAAQDRWQRSPGGFLIYCRDGGVFFFLDRCWRTGGGGHSIWLSRLGTAQYGVRWITADVHRCAASMPRVCPARRSPWHRGPHGYGRQLVPIASHRPDAKQRIEDSRPGLVFVWFFLDTDVGKKCRRIKLIESPGIENVGAFNSREMPHQ